MTTEGIIHSQKVYSCNDENLMRDQQKCLELLYDYNHTRPSETEKREALLSRMFAEIGEGCYRGSDNSGERVNRYKELGAATQISVTAPVIMYQDRLQVFSCRAACFRAF